MTRRHAEHLQRQRMRTVICSLPLGQQAQAACATDCSCAGVKQHSRDGKQRRTAGWKNSKGLRLSSKGICGRGWQQAHFLRRPPHSPVSDPQWAQVCRWRGIGAVTAGPRSRQPLGTRGLGWHAWRGGPGR